MLNCCCSYDILCFHDNEQLINVLFLWCFCFSSLGLRTNIFHELDCSKQHFVWTFDLLDQTMTLANIRKVVLELPIIVHYLHSTCFVYIGRILRSMHIALPSFCVCRLPILVLMSFQVYDNFRARYKWVRNTRHIHQTNVWKKWRNKHSNSVARLRI